ncbi:phosphoserine phosphatase [Rosenbergiella epipactidis]|uniref:phosphoserine phosphatase n=1 Tax=Rosenbergiella epipactidis TaxID=1544694 RepID=UPI001F4E8859|nr:phosphoserine phosphatase [Rosenbergiella epipactidis]
MPNRLSWSDLPTDVTAWPGLPLSLNGDEVMPLDYRAGRSGWLLFGRSLDKQCLTDFQQQLDGALVLVSAWCVGEYTVLRLAGSLTTEARKLAYQFELDVAALGQLPELQQPGLLVMDMDSTAIEIECIDEIAVLAGCGEQVAEVTEKAMRGELDFQQSLRERVAQLAGADEAILQQVVDRLPLMPGLELMVDTLQSRGWQVAIASGGFTFFADHLQQKLKLSAVAANQLEIVNGKLTGQVLGDIVDAKYKATFLEKLAARYELPRSQTVAIGDGANDLVMIQAAGLGIAYHAKPKVNEKSEVAIRFADLTGVLCILTGSLNHESR